MAHNFKKQICGRYQTDNYWHPGCLECSLGHHLSTKTASQNSVQHKKLLGITAFQQIRPSCKRVLEKNSSMQEQNHSKPSCSPDTFTFHFSLGWPSESQGNREWQWVGKIKCLMKSKCCRLSRQYEGGKKSTELWSCGKKNSEKMK